MARGEVHEDGERHVSPRIDPLSSSFYFDIKRKVKPIVQKGSCQQAKWATGLVACGIFEMVVGRWALSEMVRRASGGQYNSVGAFLRKDTAQKEAQKEAPADVGARELAFEEESITGEARSAGTRGAVAGSAVLGLLVVAAALGRQRARRARSGPKGISRSESFCSVVESSGALSPCTPRSCPNDSDISTSWDETPDKLQRSALRHGGKQDKETESSDSDINSDSEEEEAVKSDDWDLEAKVAKAFQQRRTSRAMGRQLTEPMTMGRQLTAPLAGKIGDGQEMTRRRSTSGTGVPFRGITASGAPQGNPDDLLKSSNVKYGEKGFVRQRTLEYERKIDFHRICTENGEKDWSDDPVEYSMDLKTSFFRIGTDLPADA